MPCEFDQISREFKNEDLAQVLSIAMRALSVAENVIAKQADAILQSTCEISSYLQEKRVSESLPSSLSTSTPKDTAVNFLPMRNLIICPAVGSESSNEKHMSYASAVGTASSIASPRTEVSTESTSSNVSSIASLRTDGSTESHDFFRAVKTRRTRKRKTSKIATGCKQGIILGSCYRKMDVFLSRMGPDVTADQVQDFCKTLLADWCEVEMLNSKFPALYSSFKITCYSRHNDKILDPINWETGALIRPFYRQKSNL